MEKKKKICVISGNPVTSRLLSALISSNGFHVHHACFSIDEINNLKNDGPRPDVVIYDIAEPQIGGTGVCELIERFTISKITPKIIISSFEIDCTECFERQESKCAHFLKPWRGKELLGKISEFAN